MIDIQRVGEWGSYVWVHELECGHRERRSRRAGAERIGCVKCAEPDYEVSDELGLIYLKQRLASKLRVPADAIDLRVDAKEGRLRVLSATAFLSVADVKRLSR